MNPDYASKAYEQLCESYRAIDEFRGKLLGFLPLATGVGLFVAAKESPAILARYATPLGVAGMLITAGLYLFEIHGILRCGLLIETGRQFEQAWNVRGQFTRDAEPKGGLWTFLRCLFDVPLAAGLVYATVMILWLCLLLTGGQDAITAKQGWGVAGLFVVMALIPLVCDHASTKHSEKGEPVHASTVRIRSLQPPVEIVLCRECSKALLAGPRQ